MNEGPAPAHSWPEPPSPFLPPAPPIPPAAWLLKNWLCESVSCGHSASEKGTAGPDAACAAIVAVAAAARHCRPGPGCW